MKEIVDEEKIRFFLIIIIVVAIILFVSGVGNVLLFLVIGFAIIILLLLGVKSCNIIETYVCEDDDEEKDLETYEEPVHLNFYSLVENNNMSRENENKSNRKWNKTFIYRKV